MLYSWNRRQLCSAAIKNNCSSRQKEFGRNYNVLVHQELELILGNVNNRKQTANPEPDNTDNLESDSDINDYLLKLFTFILFFFIYSGGFLLLHPLKDKNIGELIQQLQRISSCFLC